MDRSVLCAMICTSKTFYTDCPNQMVMLAKWIVFLFALKFKISDHYRLFSFYKIVLR